MTDKHPEDVYCFFCAPDEVMEAAMEGQPHRPILLDVPEDRCPVPLPLPFSFSVVDVRD